MAEEEEKKGEEEQPADSEGEEEQKKSESESKTEKEEGDPPEPPPKVPTVEDIEDVLKEALMDDSIEQEVESPDVKARLTEEDVPDVNIQEKSKVPEVEKTKEVVEKEEPVKVEAQEQKVEEPKPAEVSEPPKEKEIKKEKTEQPEAPKEEKKEQAQGAIKPPREKNVREEKPKKVEKKEAPEKKPEPEKPARKKADKSKIDMAISPLLFGRFDLTEVEVADPGLRKYINLAPVGIPHTGARHANRWLGKTKINIVERLINSMMRTEHATGKKSFAYKTVNNAFDIIAKRTKKNPIQVFVDALQNASPKEEITRLRFGGISVPKAVDTSSSRRLDIALRNICKGAVSSSHRNRKHMEVCLAEEIILASKGDMNSFAISKKEETERIAASAR